MNENGILHLILAKRPEKVRMEMEYWHPPVSRIPLFLYAFLVKVDFPNLLAGCMIVFVV
jgi:hypothetical protein